MSIITPTIHLNGSDPVELRAAYTEAWRAVEAAVELLAKTAPNGRDYYPQQGITEPDPVGKAVIQHRDRLSALRGVANELIALATHCDGFTKVCPKCEGTGREHVNPEASSSCPWCKGEGIVRK